MKMTAASKALLTQTINDIAAQNIDFLVFLVSF